MRRLAKGLIVGAVVAGLGVILGLNAIGNDFEKHVGLAWLFKTRGAIEPPAEIAIVAINNRATQGLGLPDLPRDWSRTIHARLVDNLTALGASAIVFDMDFRRPKLPEDDLAFAAAVERADRVVLFENLDGKRQPVEDANGRRIGSVWVEERVPPLPALAQAARGLAPFPVPKVQVNVFQFWAFKPSAGDVPTLPAVALQIHTLADYDVWRQLLDQLSSAEQAPLRVDDVQDAAQLREVMLLWRRMFVSNPDLSQRVVDVLDGDFGQALSPRQRQTLQTLAGLYSGNDHRYLNFYGPPGSIPTIPFNVVIQSEAGGTVDVKDKVVFVGFSDLFDPGQPDRFFTVFTRDDGVDLSGVEIAATAFGNLLSDHSVKPSNALMTTLILALIGLILGTGLYFFPALMGVPLALVLSGLYVGGVLYTFNEFFTWLPLAIPMLVQLPLALLMGLLGQYLLERRRQRRASKAVSYYLPDHVAKELTEKEIDPSSLNKVVSGICLATDMSGFTTISERMAPDELAAFMNTYFETLARALNQHAVDVTEFHADTIMCAWTAELNEVIKHDHAAHASLEVVEAVRQFNEQSGVSLYPRIGLADGPFYLGHTGGGGRFGYSILGDCANTAARIEGLNKHLGTHILATRSAVHSSHDLLLRDLGQFSLVGKTESVAIVEILTAKAAATPTQQQLCERFAEAMHAFNQQQWDAALALFERLIETYPQDGPARFFVGLCRDYQTQSPSDQEPTVIRMTAK